MTERFSSYTPPISPDLRRKYEMALDGELRWQGGWQSSDKEESDLDHVKAIFDIHDEISFRYPALFSEVDSEEAPHMIYLHDGGEIGGLDLSHSVLNYDEIRKKTKKRERATFRLLTRMHIDDIELREYARQIYKRFEKKSPDDKTANYVQLIDKVQATRFGAVFVFPGRKLRTHDARNQQINHAFGLFVGPAKRLLPLLGREAQGELMEFMDQELSRFRSSGYRAPEVDFYRKLMGDVLQLETTSA